jgi:orotate phosphoribosyltransferase
MENAIEGKISPGQKVCVIEDLVSTGGSSIKAAKALQDNNFFVLGLAAIFTYGFPIADKNFAEANINLYTLSNYFDMVQEAVQKGIIKADQEELLSKWRSDPENWQK